MTGKLLSTILQTPPGAVVVCRTPEERDFMRTRAKLCGRPDISYHTADERVDFVSASEIGQALMNIEQQRIDEAIEHGAEMMRWFQERSDEGRSGPL